MDLWRRSHTSDAGNNADSLGSSAPLLAVRQFYETFTYGYVTQHITNKNTLFVMHKKKRQQMHLIDVRKNLQKYVGLPTIIVYQLYQNNKQK